MSLNIHNTTLSNVTLRHRYGAILRSYLRYRLSAIKQSHFLQCTVSVEESSSRIEIQHAPLTQPFATPVASRAASRPRNLGLTLAPHFETSSKAKETLIMRKEHLSTRLKVLSETARLKSDLTLIPITQGILTRVGAVAVTLSKQCLRNGQMPT